MGDDEMMQRGIEGFEEGGDFVEGDLGVAQDVARLGTAIIPNHDTRPPKRLKKEVVQCCVMGILRVCATVRIETEGEIKVAVGE